MLDDLVSDGLMTVPAACEFLAVSRSSVWKMMQDGELPFVNVGRARRIPRAAIKAYVSKGLRGTL